MLVVRVTLLQQFAVFPQGDVPSDGVKVVYVPGDGW